MIFLLNSISASAYTTHFIFADYSGLHDHTFSHSHAHSHANHSHAENLYDNSGIGSDITTANVNKASKTGHADIFSHEHEHNEANHTHLCSFVVSNYPMQSLEFVSVKPLVDIPSIEGLHSSPPVPPPNYS